MNVINDYKYIGFIAVVVCLLIFIKADTNGIIKIIGVLLGIIMMICIKFNEYPVRLVYVQIIYNSVIKFGNSCLGIPNSANFITDIFTLLIAGYALIELKHRKMKKNMCLPMLIVCTFFLFTVIGFIINGQSIYLYAWAFRNNFRFYIFFFGCIVLLRKKDIDAIFKIILYISIINVVLSTIQYFVFGINQDFLGGIFGTNVGSNGYTNIFICVVCIIALVQFLSSKIPVSLLMMAILSSVYIATLSELKMFFIELIIIMVFLVIFSKPSKKIIFITLACLPLLYGAIQLLYVIFPDFQNFFTIDTMISYGTNHYSNETDLGRLTATTEVTDMFLSDDKSKYLFGLGLGSAESSQISVFNSKFYNEYGILLHYNWFSSAFMLIENGWLGLDTYLLFFVSIIYSSFKIRKYSIEIIDYCIMAQIFGVLCCIYVYYNCSLRTEAGYYAYFMLSLPFVISNEVMKIDYEKS